MKIIFKPDQEIERNRELTEALKEKDPMLSTNPKAYNMALVKYGKILDGLTHYLGKAIEQNQTNEQ